MTREEALNKAINIVRYFEANFAKSKEARENAAKIIEALEQEPICPSHGIDCEDCPAYKPCEDAISREDALMALTGEWTEITDEIIHRFIKRIKALPSVNPQPKTGHWSHDGSHWKNRFICSECGYKLFDEPTNYCPNCGASMVEPQESEEQE